MSTVSTSVSTPISSSDSIPVAMEKSNVSGDYASHIYICMNDAIVSAGNPFTTSDINMGNVPTGSSYAPLGDGSGVLGYLGSLVKILSGLLTINITDITGANKATVTSAGYITVLDGSDGSVVPGTVASHSSLAGSVYNAIPVASSSGDQVALQSDINGNLKVNTIIALPTTNVSGSIAVSDVFQILFTANSSRNSIIIQNPSDATEPIYVYVGSAYTSATVADSYRLDPGKDYVRQGPVVPSDIVAVMAVTVAHPFYAEEQ
jgi:hypothetical protein